MPKLTFAERWILSNQYEILQRLESGSSGFYQQAIDILRNGYEDEYHYAAQYVKPDETILEPAIAAETRDILQMFSDMKIAYDELEDKEGVDTTLLTFWGFDANHNIDHLSYAKYLANKGEYPDIRVRNCNSDTIGIYRVMVEAWKALPRKGLKMTREDLQAISDAPRLANMPIPDNVIPFQA